MKGGKINLSRQELIQMFPIMPYEVQVQIASTLYSQLSKGENKVMIVESPTGTGKTYSLLAGTAKWLMDHPSEMAAPSKDDSVSLPSWLPRPSVAKSSNMQQQKQDRLEQLQTIQNRKKRPRIPDQKEHFAHDEDWQYNDEIPNKSAKSSERNYHEIQEDQCLPKIIFTSRTHSQLSQVMDSIEKMGLELKSVALASKDYLCVNDKIPKNNVHEKCQELLSKGKCSFYHRDELVDFFDVKLERSKQLGEKHKLCSYYGVKNISPLADIVCVPYISILNPDIRKKLKINLNNSIIIFDQAHNILEQDSNLHSSELNYYQLQQLCSKIDQYKQKYQNKMKIMNLRIIEHMQQICRAIMTVLKSKYEEKKIIEDEEEKDYIQMDRMDFFIQLTLQQVQYYKIKRYIELSNFDQKLIHFSENKLSTKIIQSFLSFLQSLTSIKLNKAEKKIPHTIILIKNLTGSKLSEVSVKIFCMEPMAIVQIINKARMVILAGGTMSPIESLSSLFRQHEIKYRYLKYPHIIGRQQCSVYPISNEPSKPIIRFTHFNWKKGQKHLLDSTYSLLSKIISKTEQKSGIVVFIQNYQLMSILKERLGQSILGLPIFYDTPEKQSDILEQFKAEIQQKLSSALLISVMGGKLSEGINFTDNLARSLVVLGLPYPNIKAPEVKEKMKYLNEKVKLKVIQSKQYGHFGAPYPSGILQTGQSYYENCCLKTLNQTIGRAIRHKKDYANIYLIDERFLAIGEKLSSWLVERISDFTF